MDSNLALRSVRAVWHPCTQMQHLDSHPPLAISKAKGSYLYDETGRPYLDAISSWWTCLLGHNHPYLLAEISDQLHTLDHVMLSGFTHNSVVELSERLTKLTGLGHAFYGCDGASSVEIALKMSAHYWKNKGKSEKSQFLSLEGGYHGETLGALGVTDIDLFQKSYASLIRHTGVLPVPQCKSQESAAQQNDAVRQALSQAEHILSTQASHVACIIVEPLVQCARGMVMYPDTYLTGLTKLCKRHDVHLIADEIAVGFGRTGSFFAYEQAHIQPDIVCLSKALTGGTLPLSVTLCTDMIYDAFFHPDIRQGFLHSHSYTGNPILCRAALATVRYLETNPVLIENREKSIQFSKIFAPLTMHKAVVHARNLGMIWAWDFDESLIPPDFSAKLARAARKQGVLIRPIGRTLYFMPPYCSTSAEATHLVDACLMAIHDTIDAGQPQQDIMPALP